MSGQLSVTGNDPNFVAMFSSKSNDRDTRPFKALVLDGDGLLALGDFFTASTTFTSTSEAPFSSRIDCSDKTTSFSNHNESSTLNSSHSQKTFTPFLKSQSRT
jgi:hypothetical protein